MSDLRTFDEIDPGDAGSVGGKALGLGRMARAGLPVPPGFCVTTAAYRRVRGRPLREDESLAGEVAAAYRRLGGGPVAVRSSAFSASSRAFLAVRLLTRAWSIALSRVRTSTPGGTSIGSCANVVDPAARSRIVASRRASFV